MFLRIGVVRKLEIVSYEDDGFFGSLSVTQWYSSAVTVLVGISYFVSASYYDRKLTKMLHVSF